jgi:hypothetical protein
MGKRRGYWRRFRRRPEHDAGAILLLALLFLLLLGIVSTAVVQTGTLQMRMALNEQLQVEALQDARALARALTAIPENFRVEQPVGSARCAVLSLELGCDLGELQLPSYQAVTQGARIDYRVVRQWPEFRQASPLRSGQSDQLLEPVSRIAVFEVQVRVDGSSAGLGSAEAVRGVALHVPDDLEHQNSPQADAALPVEPMRAYGLYWRYPQFDPL